MKKALTIAVFIACAFVGVKGGAAATGYPTTHVLTHDKRIACDVTPVFPYGGGEVECASKRWDAAGKALVFTVAGRHFIRHDDQLGGGHYLVLRGGNAFVKWLDGNGRLAFTITSWRYNGWTTVLLTNGKGRSIDIETNGVKTTVGRL